MGKTQQLEIAAALCRPILLCVFPWLKVDYDGLQTTWLFTNRLQ